MHLDCPHCHSPIELADNASPTEVPPVNKLERSRRRPQSNQRAAVLARMFVLLLLSAAVIISSIGYLNSTRALHDTEDRWQIAVEQEQEARRARDEQEAARLGVEKKEQQTRASLRLALLHQADALQQSSVAGRRGLALDALRQAAAIRPDAGLREVFLRCLYLPDPHAPSRVLAFDPPAGGQRNPLQIDFLQFSPNERWLACIVNDSDLHLIDLADPSLAHTRLATGLRRAGLAFSSEGDKLWSADQASADDLWQLPSPRSTRSSPDPTRAPSTLGFDSRGDRIAVGAESAVDVKMVDLATGKVLWSHAERAVPAGQALFSPDGKQFAAAFQTPTGPKIKAWVSQTRALALERTERPVPLFFRGEHLQALVEPSTLATKDLQDLTVTAGLRQPRVPAIASPSNGDQFLLSADGSLCAESGLDKSTDVAVWDLGKKALRARLRRSGQPSPVVWSEDQATTLLHRKTLSRDGSLLAALNGAGVEVWETEKGMSLINLPTTAHLFAFAKLDDKSDQLIVIETDGTVSTWRSGAKTATKLTKLRLDANSALDQEPTALITPDGKRVLHLALTTEPPTLDVWDLASGERLAQFPVPVKFTPANPFPGARHRLALSPDGSKLAVVSPHVTLKAWDRDAGRELLSLGALDGTTRLWPLALSRDSDSVLILWQKASKWTIKVFDLVERAEMVSLDLSNPAVCGALADRASLAALGVHHDVLVFDPRLQRQAALVELKHHAPVSAVAFDQAGKVLASVSAADGTVRLWNPKTGEQLASFSTGQSRSTQAALSPTGRWLAVGDAEGKVRLWDLAESRRQLREVGLDWPAPAITVAAKPAAGTAGAFMQEANGHHLFGRYAQAVAAYGKALKLDDNQALAYRDRGEALFALGRAAEAAADFEKAKELAPELPSSPTFLAALEARGLARAESGRWDEARADFQKAIKEGAEKDRNQQEVARLRLAAGDLPGYRRACQRLVEQLAEKEPHTTIQKVVWTCALAPNTFPEYARLIERAEDTVDSHPKDPLYHTTLGALLCRAGQIDAAIQRLLHAISLREQQGQPRDWLFLALAYQQVGHAEDAKKWLEKAVRWLERAGAEKSQRLADHEQLELQILRREAETLINGPGTSRKK